MGFLAGVGAVLRAREYEKPERPPHATTAQLQHGSLVSGAVNDVLSELAERLQETAVRLRAGELDSESALQLIEECARLASQASAKVEEHARAALEPLPDLPGQLPLPAA